ncbi:MAG: ABC transporter permease, partial [Clostridiaceae bacterium]|nr:ABC transporter permease [Clostridiaceae bacterium]
MSKKTSRFIQGLRSNSKEFTLFAVLVVTVIVLSLLTGGKFTSSANIQSMAAQLPEFGFFALGMMIVILTGGINLSVVN